ncbi:MAG: hypothetical protein ACE5DM_04970, partial [Candidatus Nanoarchaeia archaeon]
MKHILFIIVLVLSTTPAFAGGIGIHKVKIDVDNYKVYPGSFEVRPGDDLDTRVTVENTFPDSSDHDFEEVEVTAWIEGIDAGDDIEDSEIFSLRADDDKSVHLYLDLPKTVDKYSYTLYITAVAYDEDHVEFTDEENIDMRIDVKKHDIEFTEAVARNVGCDQATIAFTIDNKGSRDEDVEITARFDGEEVFDKDVDIDSGDEYDRQFTIALTGKTAGSYRVYLEAEYDDGDETKSDIVVFNKPRCDSTSFNNDYNNNNYNNQNTQPEYTEDYY